MPHVMTDTIYAQATAAGRAGVAIIRISGPAAAAALTALAGEPIPTPRRAALRHLRDPETEEVMDQALVLWFPGPGSFTGEDVVELHTHGGRAVIGGVVAALGRLPGVRLAEPGEFTRRAFDSGRLDLTEVEGLADLIAAETATQRRQALRQMEGVLGRKVEDWRERLVRLLAHAEADIDFPEDDLPGGLSDAVAVGVTTLADEITAALNDGGRGQRLRDGARVVIIGAPNVGKSSLLNAIARRDVAIVSDIAGTTRDVVEVHLDLGGLPVTIADTAGLREGGDVIEREGMARARARIAEADVVVAVTDGGVWPAIDPETRALFTTDTVLAVNKADLLLDGPALAMDGVGEVLTVSARTGAGMDRLLDVIQARCAGRLEGAESGAITRARHRDALESCRAHLAAARIAPLPELGAEELRLAVRALGRITGRVDVEDLLDVIFGDFCIGK